MHVYAYSLPPNDGERNQHLNQHQQMPTSTFEPFFSQRTLYWLVNLLIGLSFSVGKFFRWVKWTNETANLKGLSSITYFCIILIDKHSHHYNFAELANFSFTEAFVQCAYKHVCLNMHCFCSIDSWMRILITDNAISIERLNVPT